MPLKYKKKEIYQYMKEKKDNVSVARTFWWDRALRPFWGDKDYPEIFLNGPLKFQMRNLHQIQVSRGRESNTIGVNIDISKSIVKWWIIIHNLSYDGYRNFKH